VWTVNPYGGYKWLCIGVGCVVTKMKTMDGVCNTNGTSSAADARMVSYTVHHNWEWVVDEALASWANGAASTGGGDVVKLGKCARSRDLPSQRHIPRQKGAPPQYALFRVETAQSSSSSVSSAVWATSSAFVTVDPKDALFAALESNGAAELMPATTLIAWDVEKEDDIPELPMQPILLKGACGSGGFGLYFVYSKTDALSVIKFHANKARSEPSFVEKLEKRSNGKMPMWSLQSIVPAKKVFGDRRCQIRAYVVYCNGQLFLYNGYEVRVPSWGDQTMDALIASPESNADGIDVAVDSAGDPVEDFEAACCAGSNARPYNRGRVKVETQRFALEEMDELQHVKEDITLCLVRAMAALKPVVLQSAAVDVAYADRTTLAIAGVDLSLEDTETGHVVPRILEFNNNPAMPGIGKSMTVVYRKSLVNFVRSAIRLGLSGDTENFTSCW
jgi:hypothetical protein